MANIGGITQLGGGGGRMGVVVRNCISVIYQLLLPR